MAHYVRASEPTESSLLEHERSCIRPRARVATSRSFVLITLVSGSMVGLALAGCGSKTDPGKGPSRTEVATVTSSTPSGSASSASSGSSAKTVASAASASGASSAVGAPSGSAAPTAKCSEILASHHRIIKAMGVFPEDDPNRWHALDEATVCVDTPKGAWAAVVENAKLTPPTEKGGMTGASGARTFIFSPADGKPARLAVEATWDHYHHESVEAPVLFDWDGDGTPEAFFLERGDVHEGASWEKGWVLTFKNGKVQKFAAKGLDGVNPLETKDVDGDGKLDFLASSPFEGTAEGMAFDYAVKGPKLLIHALADGTFSRDDAAAKAHAKKTCASKPEKITPPLLASAMCAHLWGMPAAQIQEQVTATCKDVQRDPSNPLTETCNDVAVLKDWLKKSPPLSLQ